MEWSKARILLVDDSKTIRQITGKALTERGYDVRLAATGAEGLEALQAELPDLVILDVELPDLDGFEVCRRIKADPRMHRLPVLVLTVLDQPGFEVIAIDAGADDFVTKPVDPLVLDARVGMIVRRTRRERHVHPLTGLPGDVLVDQEITCRLKSGKPFALCAVDLARFKQYNDEYGYDKGDQVLLMVATVLQSLVLADGSAFLGHLGADDFVFMTSPKSSGPLANEILKNFDQAIPLYYDKKTRQRGYFEVVSRRGSAKRVPLLTMSIAKVSNEKETFASSIEMLDALVELKHYAKTFGESVYVIDRRDAGAPKRLSAGKKPGPEK
ncbi:MAG: response regulator [Actinobacteria bacterium]|nr:MAG: response regulator [Actinomycetota bacterium]